MRLSQYWTIMGVWVGAIGLPSCGPDFCSLFVNFWRPCLSAADPFCWVAMQCLAGGVRARPQSLEMRGPIGRCWFLDVPEPALRVSQAWAVPSSAAIIPAGWPVPAAGRCNAAQGTGEGEARSVEDEAQACTDRLFRPGVGPLARVPRFGCRSGARRQRRPGTSGAAQQQRCQ